MKYIVANWKMNLGVRESAALAKHALHLVQGREVVPQIVLCPSFTALHEVHKVVTHTRLLLGAQDVGPERSGAFTGAVGAAQLADVGVTYVIVGHAERRQYFGETDVLIRAKLQAVLAAGMTPILCVSDVQQAEHFFAGLAAFPRQGILTIAYEPPDAIGTGQPISITECLPVLTALRTIAMQRLLLPADRIKMFYGGSVTAPETYAFLREIAVDGVLVGGASLRPHDFTDIVQAACDVLETQQGA